MNYFLSFTLAFIFSIIFTKISRKLAIRYKILDYPETAPERKIHKTPIPLLGGLSLYFSFFLTIFLVFLFKIWPNGNVSLKQLFALFISSTILIIGGVIDEKKNLKPGFQLIFSILSVLIIIAFGIGVKYINNPFADGLIFLEKSKIEIFKIKGVSYYFSWPADLITFIWLLLIIYAVKLLAGLDGLVPGITSIGGIIIFSLCLFTKFYQPDVGLLALILTAVSLGFLIFNFHPAKIFLGTSGETFSGFLLGVLAIISGGKFATLLLILGIPILDLIWVVFRRIFKEKKSPMLADRKHLHYRLLDLGFSHRKAVIFLWLLSLSFGLIGILFPKTKVKIFAIFFLVIFMLGLATFITYKTRLKLKTIKFDKNL